MNYYSLAQGLLVSLFLKKKIEECIPSLLKNLKYTQNKYLWIKASMGILSTDTKPKMAMDECKIGNTAVKIY